ncbi:hypothetical protein [Streptomyces acidicola]|uniref:hypothetical protein n=1 Tax=Streptomyces acidicola TaxID=2596892 RepID=UPI0034393C21
MSDAHTTEPPAADAYAHEASGHGKHRGQVSVNDSEATPRGRHRRQAEQTETAA